MNELGVLFGWNLCLSFLLAVMAWVLCRFDSLRKNPALCHGIWFLVLLKLATPPIIPVPLPAVLVPWAVVPRATAEPNREPAAEREHSETGSVSTQPPATLFEGQAKVLPVESRVLLEAEISDHGDRDTSWKTISLGLLAFSALITGLLWITSLRELRVIQQSVRGCRDHSDFLAQMIKDVCLGLKLRVVPRVYLIDWAITPLLWAGRGGPTIILPRQLIGSLQTDQLRQMIGHELAHYARRDHWTNLFAFLVTTLFWWNPVAWLARREMSQAAEACCDALALERFPGSRRSYAATLLQVAAFISAGSTSKPVLSMNFGGTTAIRRRIQMIADSQVRPTLSQMGGFVLLLSVPAFFLVPSQARDPQERTEAKALPSSNVPLSEVSSIAEPGTAALVIQNQPGKYYVAGTVVERETKKPVPQADLMFFSNGEIDPEKFMRTVTTDDRGQFRFEVAMGDVTLIGPILRPGFWLTPERRDVSQTVSPEKPEAIFHIEAERGPIWPVQVVVEKGKLEDLKLLIGVAEVEDDATRLKLIKDEQVSSLVRPASSQIFLGKSGKGQLTQCGKSGKLWLIVAGAAPNGLASFEGVTRVMTELLVDPAFDVGKVKSIHSVAGTDRVELFDEKGAKAIVANAKVTMENGRPLLTFHLARTTRPKQEFTGQVTDSLGKPLSDVDVGAVVGYERGSTHERKLTKTDKQGRFHMEIAMDEKEEPYSPTSVRMLLNKEGFAGFQSKEIPLSKKTGKPIDAGSFALSPGKTRPVLVVDQQGKPIAGVILHLTGDADQPLPSWRTDAQGRVVLRDLPTGSIRAKLRYRDQFDSLEFKMSPLDSENTELKMTMKASTPAKD